MAGFKPACTARGASAASFLPTPPCSS